MDTCEHWYEPIDPFDESKGMICLECGKELHIERPEFPDGEFADPRQWTDPTWGTY